MPCIFAYKGFLQKNPKSNIKMQGGISSEKENNKKTQTTQAKNSIQTP